MKFSHMLIEQLQEGGKGSFFVEEGDQWLAEMTYSLSGKELMIIDHTKVDDLLKGQNIGLQFVHAAVEYARANNLKILPLCPFARSVFEKNVDEFKDVLRGA